MDITAITQLVGSLGFPITCCGILFWMVNKSLADFSKSTSDSIQLLKESIDENTTATTKLVTTVEIIAKVGEKG